jgi:eukaryotic-like serine/threonine-protein kinase
MSDQTRVQQLLDEVLDSERTPEEVCADFPELLPEVRNRLELTLRLDAELRAMFPTPQPKRESDTLPPWMRPAELPHIPGYELEATVGRGYGIAFAILGAMSAVGSRLARRLSTA